MNTNPIADVVEQAKHQKLENDMSEIKSNLARILANTTPKLVSEECPLMTNLITLTNWADHPISINPIYIVIIKPASHGSTLKVAFGSEIETYDVKETFDEIMTLINGKKPPVYIG